MRRRNSSLKQRQHRNLQCLSRAEQEQLSKEELTKKTRHTSPSIVPVWTFKRVPPALAAVVWGSDDITIGVTKFLSFSDIARLGSCSKHMHSAAKRAWMPAQFRAVFKEPGAEAEREAEREAGTEAANPSVWKDEAKEQQPKMRSEQASVSAVVSAVVSPVSSMSVLPRLLEFTYVGWTAHNQQVGHATRRGRQSSRTQRLLPSYHPAAGVWDPVCHMTQARLSKKNTRVWCFATWLPNMDRYRTEWTDWIRNYWVKVVELKDAERMWSNYLKSRLHTSFPTGCSATTNTPRPTCANCGFQVPIEYVHTTLGTVVCTFCSNSNPAENLV